MAACIARQGRAMGISHALAPVFDICRDPRFGRMGETYGEDSTLAAAMGTAYVKGLQDKHRMSACSKHFLGFMAGQGGIHTAQAVVSPRELREVYAKPFQAAITDGKLDSVMNSYAAIDGQVPAGSKAILRDLLRGEMGFNGVTVSDYSAVEQLESIYHLAESPADAGRLALEAGMDQELPTIAAYNDELKENIRSGVVQESLLDEAVLRKNTPSYRTYPLTPPGSPAHVKNGFEWRCEVYSAEQLRQALELPFGLIYAPIRLLDENTPDKDCIAVIPPFVLQGEEEHLRNRLRELHGIGFTRAMAQTLGHSQLLKEEGWLIHGGHRMNVINSYSAEVCGRFGFEDVTLSFEGTAAQLAEIQSPIPRGIIAYGRLPLMIMRRCPVSGGAPCGRVHLYDDCGRTCGSHICDRRGNQMPVLCGGSSVEILNPDLLIMSDRMKSVEPFDFAVLKFTDEQELKPVLDMYLNDRKPNGALTRGLYFRGAE